MSTRTLRRRGRVLALRVRRNLAGHSLTVLSLVVLAVALAAALTDGSFRIAPRHDPTTASALPVEDGASLSTANAAPVASSASVIYYIVDSARQMDTLGSAMRGEAVYRTVDGSSMPSPVVRYLLFETPQQEAAGARLLNHIAELAMIEGFHLKVVDLTR